MHEDLLKGKWNTLRKKIKRNWKLKEADILQISGSEENLVKLLQEKFGYSKKQAEQEYHDFIICFECRHIE